MAGVRLTGVAALALGVMCGPGASLPPTEAPPPPPPQTDSGPDAGVNADPDTTSLDPLSAPPAPALSSYDQAQDLARQAAAAAQTARTAADWDAVAQLWLQAAAHLQTIAPTNPLRAHSQRHLRQYLRELDGAQARARQLSLWSDLPTLGSPVLDEQLTLYRSYVAAGGAPDVLIVGSSRAMQGLDPQVLQEELDRRGLPGARVYNFSVNGATAQVVGFVLRQLLTPDQYPRLVLWAGGSRAFNSGRYDRTFASILQSPGYAQIQRQLQGPPTDPAADLPADLPENGSELSPLSPLSSLLPGGRRVPISAIDAQGFLAVADQFDPATYYQQFPRVAGRYDGAYQPFQLTGVQVVSFDATARFLASQGIPLMLVNLPLSADYLDPTRLGYERQFQQFLRQQATVYGLVFIDLLEEWQQRPELFADPSHINQEGAAILARALAADPRPPWPRMGENGAEPDLGEPDLGAPDSGAPDPVGAE